jgi:hypothetical protein
VELTAAAVVSQQKSDALSNTASMPDGNRQAILQNTTRRNGTHNKTRQKQAQHHRQWQQLTSVGWSSYQ